MTNQTPQTLDDLIAAGNATLAKNRAARDKIFREEAEKQERIHQAILDAAARYFPPVVLEFAKVKQSENSEESWAARLIITIPHALPVEALFHSYTDDHSNPDSWKPATGQRECLRVIGADGFWTRSADDLHVMLALACEKYEPAPEPAPEPEPEPEPVRINLADGLINRLDRADVDWERGQNTNANFAVNWVTARALVGLMVHLEDIKISLDVIQERTPHSY